MFMQEQIMALIALRYRKKMKYTIDENDHFLCFLGGESENGLSFYPSRLDFAVPEVVIFDTNDTNPIIWYCFHST